MVGEPRLELTYSGTGSTTDGRVFAQIIDEQRGVALGNQVTPIPVTLDGKAHTVTRSLEGGAAAIAAGRALPPAGHRRQPGLRPGPRRRLDPVLLDPADAADRDGLQRPGRRGGGLLPTSRRCLSRRRFEIRVKRGRGKARLRSAKVYVEGRRVRVRRRAGRLRAVVDLRGRRKQRVTVRIVARTRSGKTLRDKRVYRTCTPKKKKRKRR